MCIWRDVHGVFLVSVKLIMMAYKLSLTNQEVLKELVEIKKLLKTKS